MHLCFLKQQCLQLSAFFKQQCLHPCAFTQNGVHDQLWYQILRTNLHHFKKLLCLFFLAKQLHYLNNFQLEKKWHYMWSTFGNDDYRTSRPSKLTHNFSYPYILNLLISTQVLRKIYHTCSPFRSDPHNDYNPHLTTREVLVL